MSLLGKTKQLNKSEKYGEVIMTATAARKAQALTLRQTYSITFKPTLHGLMLLKAITDDSSMRFLSLEEKTRADAILEDNQWGLNHRKFHVQAVAGLLESEVFQTLKTNAVEKADSYY